MFLFTIQGTYYVKKREGGGGGGGGGQPKVAGLMSGPLRDKRTVWAHAQLHKNQCCYVFLYS